MFYGYRRYRSFTIVVTIIKSGDERIMEELRTWVGMKGRNKKNMVC